MMRRGRGFTLIELLASLMLLAVFGVLATRLYALSFETLKQTRDAANSAARAQHIERALHGDTWNAKRIACPAPDRAVIDQPGERTVTWRCIDGAIERVVAVDGRDVQRDTFAALGDGARFATDGRTLRFERRDAAIVCVSQLQALRRLER